MKQTAEYCGYAPVTFQRKLREYDIPRYGPEKNKFAKSTLIPDVGFETLIFESDYNGNVIESGEIDGISGELNHEKALKKNWYVNLVGQN